MSKKKICVVITARPSYARIRSALHAISQHPDLELQIIATGSLLLNRYGRAIKVIEEDGFKIDAAIHTILEGENLITAPKTTAIQLLELTSEFQRLQPDAVITIADRYETIATAISASYMNIPLIHIQGGEVTGSIDEKVRHAITKLSDLHLVSTDGAAERVKRMGEFPQSIVVTGCPSIDLADEAIRQKPYLDDSLYEKYSWVGDRQDLSQDYIVLMQHPVTTDYESSRENISLTLQAVKRLNTQVFCFWPNPDSGSDGVSAGIRRFREVEDPSNFCFFKNIEPEDFIRLLNGAKCLIGNSSVGIRECSFLGVPVVNVGDRQQFRERGENVVDVTYNEEDIYNAAQERIANGKCKPDYTYGNAQAGIRIAKAISNWNFSIKTAISY